MARLPKLGEMIIYTPLENGEWERPVVAIVGGFEGGPRVNGGVAVAAVVTLPGDPKAQVLRIKADDYSQDGEPGTWQFQSEWAE